MKKEYKLDSIRNTPFLEWRYSEQDRLLKALTGLPDKFRTLDVTSEDGLVMAWTKFAKDALEGEYAESNLPCWEGHYEQFGRAMLNVVHMIRGKVDSSIHTPFDDILPEASEYLSEPTGTEDRILYRAWFHIIGHPDFCKQSVIGFESMTYAYWHAILNAAFYRVNMELIKQQKDD